MTPTPLTPDQIIDRLGSYGYVFDPKARGDLLLWLHRMTTRDGASMVVVEATGPDTTPTSDVVRDGADKSSRETADSCRSMENGTPLTCGLPAGHHGPHSFDPTPEGLVPDPREPGCWLGRLEDVPWPGWQIQLNGKWVERSASAYPDGAVVQARPSQTTTSPPRWTVEEDVDGWNLVMADEDEDRIMALVGHMELARNIASLLNAADVAGAAAPQPQDTT